jgi:flavin reductase (DIM6/NTAB) family NADH-FMN oxidoreductase RutF
VSYDKTSGFLRLTRQQFRRFFQPSRIVLGVFSDRSQDRVNIITICFDMYCSYKPPMMAFAIQQKALSFELLNEARECVLAVPGEKLVFCGLRSGREVDKVSECKFPLADSETVQIPGIGSAIGNIEIRLVGKVRSGDHVTAFGEVLKFGINRENRERALLSVGPEHRGYRLLARHGIHRIAVVADDVRVGDGTDLAGREPMPCTVRRR